MSARLKFKLFFSILATVAGLVFEFWLFGMLWMTPQEMSSKTTIWVQDPSVRRWGIVVFVFVALLCIAVWAIEPIWKILRAPKALRTLLVENKNLESQVEELRAQIKTLNERHAQELRTEQVNRVVERKIPSHSEPAAPNSAPPPTRVNINPTDRRICVDVSADYLLKLFEDHTEIQADKLFAPYIDQWMMIRDAEIADISKPFQYVKILDTSFRGRLGVTLASKHKTYLYFNSDWEKRVSVLRRGSKITVIGQIKSAALSHVTLENCEIVDS